MEPSPIHPNHCVGNESPQTIGESWSQAQAPILLNPVGAVPQRGKCLYVGRHLQLLTASWNSGKLGLQIKLGRMSPRRDTPYRLHGASFEATCRFTDCRMEGYDSRAVGGLLQDSPRQPDSSISTVSSLSLHPVPWAQTIQPGIGPPPQPKPGLSLTFPGVCTPPCPLSQTSS